MPSLCPQNLRKNIGFGINRNCSQWSVIDDFRDQINNLTKPKVKTQESEFKVRFR